MMQGMRTLNKKNGAPVDFYINTSTNDTVLGRGRFDGDELKVKVGNQKFKIDGDEIKIKENGVKAKMDDGEVKVKSRDGKAKYEDDKIKVKTKDSTTRE